MRRFMLVSLIVLFTGTAHAAGPASDEKPATAAAHPVGQQATRIETDQKTGAIRFIVNGQEQARIDATGLHVRGNFEYSGEAVDTPYHIVPPAPEPAR